MRGKKVNDSEDGLTAFEIEQRRVAAAQARMAAQRAARLALRPEPVVVPPPPPPPDPYKAVAASVAVPSVAREVGKAAALGMGYGDANWTGKPLPSCTCPPAEAPVECPRAGALTDCQAAAEPKAKSSWLADVRFCIVDQDERLFTLKDFLERYGQALQDLHPESHSIAPTVRHNLQKLRDRGEVFFTNNRGEYVYLPFEGRDRAVNQPTTTVENRS